MIKKYFIKFSTLLTEILYLDETDNLILQKEKLLSRYSFIYSNNDVSFDPKYYNNEKDVGYLFSENSRLLGNIHKKYQYDELVEKYVQYVISLIKETEVEVFFISCINNVTIYHALSKAIRKIRNVYFHKQLMMYHDIQLYFIMLHFKLDKSKYMLLEDVCTTFFSKGISTIDDLISELFIPSLTNAIKNEYFDNFPHFILSRGDHSDYGDFIDQKVKELLYSKILYNGLNSYIYCRDYRIRIHEFENNDYYKYLNINIMFDNIKSNHLVNDGDSIYIINNFKNKFFGDQVIKSIKGLGYKLIMVDRDNYLVNLYKYLYNIVILNEQSSVITNHVIMKRKGGINLYAMYERLKYDNSENIFFNDKELIKKYPQYKSLLMDINQITVVGSSVY